MSVKTLRRFTKIILVSINSIVALCLVAGCYGGNFDPRHFWFTGYFTLASFYFLLILAAFIFFWLFVKWGWSFIGIIAIIVCWKPLQQIVPLRSSHHFNLKKSAVDLRVMSWNVEHFDILEHRSHPERKNEMIAMINEYSPDVACFQEMVASDHFPDAINYLPDFVQQLKMYAYHYSFNAKLDFDGKHHFGIIIFSRYPIVNKKTVEYAPKTYNSIFQYVDILKGIDTVRIFNIHLQSLKFSNDNLKYIDDPSMEDEKDISESRTVMAKLKTGFFKRKKQSDRIKQIMDKSPYPVVVCGDFNDVPNSYAYRTIGRKMKNAFAEKGAGIGRTFYGISPTLRIDNIFADERFDVEQFVRIRKKVSDHFPIIADIRLRK